MTLFSKRYALALRDKRLTVSLPQPLRRRVWFELDRHDEYFGYRPDPSDPWIENSSLLRTLEEDLKREFGSESLMGYGQDDQFGERSLKEFIIGGFPSQVLDAIEQYIIILGRMAEKSDAANAFQMEVNRIFTEETAPWRLSDGQFFKVDTEFMAALLQATEEMLHAKGFAGSVAELREARNDLTVGAFKGAIVNACKAYESAMKTVLGIESGNASTLVQRMKEEGYLDDLPEQVRSSISQGVMMSLPTLRNRLGGHGQGEEVVSVPHHYADFAINLSASLIRMCIEMKANRNTAPS